MLLFVSGCGGSSSKEKTQEPGPPPRVEEKLPAFRALPVRATVTPRRGGPTTTFRIRFRPRGFVGVRARSRSDYEARVSGRSRSGCIFDTRGRPASSRAPLDIVLDPTAQEGDHWCRGRFRVNLVYYRAFACPANGTCHPPKEFPEPEGRVARLTFEVR